MANRTIDIPPCINCKVVHCTAFANCSEEALVRIGASRKPIEFVDSEQIFAQGGQVEAVYCVYSGRVDMVKLESAAGHLLDSSETGELLGANDLLNSRPHSCSAVAASGTVACRIPADVIRTEIKRSPSIIVRVMQSVCRCIERIEEKLDKTPLI